MEDILVTTKGHMPASKLRKNFLVEETEKAIKIATEYFDETDELVRRDLHVHLKQGLNAQIEQGMLNG